MNARKRGNALLLCIGLVLVLLVSSAFLIQEAVQLIWSVLAVSRSDFHIPGFVRLHTEGTPVSRKTRIND